VPAPHAPSAPRLRLATATDVPALDALIGASVRGLSVGHYTPAQIEGGVRHVFGVDTQLVRDGTYFVIEADGGPVACGGWSARRTLYGGDQHKDADDPPLDPAREPARIRAFFVHPDWARRGLGRQLFTACHAAARDAGFRSLALVATLPGVPLYEALGFVRGAPVDVRLPDGAVLPCVQMTRPI
jgi:GNAT superfamily N-acetyltransferase